MRIYAMVADDSTNLDHFVRNGKIEDERLIVRSVKVYADGALGSRGALLKAPYSDQPEHHGLQLATREHFLEIAQWCERQGFQMNTHCIGDCPRDGRDSTGRRRVARAPPPQAPPQEPASSGEGPSSAIRVEPAHFAAHVMAVAKGIN